MCDRFFQATFNVTKPAFLSTTNRRVSNQGKPNKTLLISSPPKMELLTQMHHQLGALEKWSCQVALFYVFFQSYS